MRAPDLNLNVTPMAFDYKGKKFPRRDEQGVPHAFVEVRVRVRDERK
jgi:hypothetical protein